MGTRRTRGAVVAALAAAGAAVLSSCAVPGMLLTAPTPAPAAAPVVAGPAAPPVALEPFYTQVLAWGPCLPLADGDRERELFGAPGVECARLTVPLDYDEPGGRTAEIGVLRARWTGERGEGDRRIGSLVLNPGGPGGSGMDLAASFAAQGAAGVFDIVGFDPRGVGKSTPTIDCTTDAEWDALRAESAREVVAEGPAAAEEQARQDAERCVQRSGGADVLAHSGTRDVARDMDVLRAALGDEKLTYLGYSYGTRIGSTYAEMFPGNVRAMVLDGAVDPTQTAAESALAQMAGFQGAFDAYAAACTQHDGCPLGADRSRTTAAFQGLTRPLLDHPAPVADGRTLSYGDAVTAVIASLYNPAAWPDLTKGLVALRAGDGTPLMAEADRYYGRGPDGHYGNDQEALMVVNCVDGDRMTDRAQRADLQRRAAQVAPFADPGLPVGDGALDTCAMLPVTPTSQPHLPHAEGLPPTLVISTTGDPATPYRAGVDLAAALGARLITVEGTRHTAALQGNSCVDSAVGAYLVKLRVPSEDPHCRFADG
ncbi:alpha/beta hydrolase [Pseudonocardia kujensis]|uniref:alpha/beta hydrolase n=1 Tax=Pseudonocardia kujensis TaxID=1128675 RepID=UPI001E3436F3|nr:alpha/beta hydrolase [Pseudonocardia kujensis]MCE0767272.1 alpha/beta hydrolase [Pseudonocardia kujensis]